MAIKERKMKQFRSIAFIFVGIIICGASVVGGFFAITNITKAMSRQSLLITIVFAIALILVAAFSIALILFSTTLIYSAVNDLVDSKKENTEEIRQVGKNVNFSNMSFINKSEFAAFIKIAKTQDEQPLFDEQTQENILKILDTQTDFSAQQIHQEQKERELFLEAQNQLDEFIKDV